MTDARTESLLCTLTPGCGFPPHDAVDHPCGQPIQVGDPCAYCGDPIGADADGAPVPCPRCWRPITIADLKAIAAEAGLDAQVTVKRPTGGSDRGD